MKLILLTRDKFAMVDDEDFEMLTQWKWSVIKFSNSFYAKRGVYEGKISFGNYGSMQSVSMHRFIMKCTYRDGKMIDHIDGNGLNNQKYNLRFCSYSQNNMNKRKKILKAHSQYKGVDFNKNQWRSRVSINKKIVHIGYFINEIDAAKAYDKKAIELHGEFANLNFK